MITITLNSTASPLNQLALNQQANTATPKADHDMSMVAPFNETLISLHEIAKHIYRSKRTTVLTGAGISCNAGIPDFRSAGGLYDLAKEKHPRLVVKGQDLFDISLFRDEISLALFCTFMESLYKSTLLARPTETHRFIKMLKEKKKLLRCYTQNIDALEREMHMNTGINISDFEQKRGFGQAWRNLDVVQLHGNLHKLSCTMCYSTFDWTEKYRAQLSDGCNPQCESCEAKHLERLYSGKRVSGSVGVLRPDIVLYGENHPQADILAQGINVDLKLRPDMLIIMGTSLRVDGVKKLVRLLSNSVHAQGGKTLFVNKTPLSKAWEKYIDYQVLSDCDEFVQHLKHEIPDLWLTQDQLDSKYLRGIYKVEKPKTSLKVEKGVKVEKAAKIEKDPETNETLATSSGNLNDITMELLPPSAVKLHTISETTQVKNETVSETTHKVKKEKVAPIRLKPTVLMQTHHHVSGKTQPGHTEETKNVEISQHPNNLDSRIKSEQPVITITPPITPTKRARPTLKRKAPSTTTKESNKKSKSPETIITPQNSFSATSSASSISSDPHQLEGLRLLRSYSKV